MPIDIYQWLNRAFTTPSTAPGYWANPYWTENWYKKWYRPPNYETTGTETPLMGDPQKAGWAAFAQLAVPFLTPVDVGSVLTSLKTAVPESAIPEEMKPLFNAANWTGWTRTQQRTAAQGYERAYTQAARLQTFQQLLNALEEEQNSQTSAGVAWANLPEAVRNWIKKTVDSAIGYYSKRRTYGEQLEFLQSMTQQLNTQFPEPTGDAEKDVNAIPSALVRQIAEVLKRLVLPTTVGAGWGQTGWTPIGGSPVAGYRGRGSWY